MSDFVPTDSNSRDPFPRTSGSQFLLLREGDEEQKRAALETLIERYTDVLCLRVRSRLRRRRHPDTDDLADSFLSYVFSERIFEKFDVTKRFRNFMEVVIRNYCYAEVRRLRTAMASAGVDISELDPADEPTATSDSASQADKEWLRGVIKNALIRMGGTNQRTILCWSYGIPLPGEKPEVKSRQEIARELSITENTLDVSRHNARKNFLKRLQEEIVDLAADAEARREEEGELLGVCKEIFPHLAQEWALEIAAERSGQSESRGTGFEDQG